MTWSSASGFGSEAERSVIRHASVASGAETVEDAQAEMELLDYDFHLFVEKYTGRDGVIYRTAEGCRVVMTRPARQMPIRGGTCCITATTAMTGS